MLPAGRALAGPWVQPRGAHFAKFTASYLYTRAELDADGDKVPILTSNPLVRAAAYREVAVAGYVEYGLLDRLTLVGSLPFKIATSNRTEISSDASLVREVDVTNAGLADLFVTARGALRRGRFPVALESGVKLPLGYERVPENGGPALGTGDPDVQVSLLAGYGAASVYASAGASYRVRGGDVDDEAGFAVEAGGHYRRIFGQGRLEGWSSTGQIRPLAVSSTMRVANQDALKLIAAAGARTGAHASLTAEVYHVLGGKNTAAGTTVAVALVLAP